MLESVRRLSIFMYVHEASELPFNNENAMNVSFSVFYFWFYYSITDQSKNLCEYCLLLSEFSLGSSNNKSA